LLILGVPLVTWPLVMAGKTVWGADLLSQLILLTASGHYFATFVRAYGDRDLFQRFRTRFLLVPVLLMIGCISMFASGHGPALMLVTMGWAFWHWLAQAFGFARIYDIKAGSFGRYTSWLDKALVITGFVGAVVLTDGATAEFAKTFLGAGYQLPTAEQFDVVQDIVLGAMILVGVAYVTNLVVTIVRQRPWSWQKQVMHVMTIGYYWFAFAWLPNVLIAYVLYEFFHDVQYYAITWLTCRQRVQRPGITKWLGRMFRPGWLAALGFVLLMSMFGGVDALARGSLDPQQLGHQVWLGIFVAFALLHYYYDGFIWKARESSLGSDLGIQGGLRSAVVPGLRHAADWCLFVVPLVAVVIHGEAKFSPRERAEALVALAPGDFLSHADLGLELTRARELPAALEHYRTSIAIHPGLAQTRANYGAALDLAGDLEGAREQYEAAFACSDHGGAHRQAHINLGVLLLYQGKRAAGLQHVEAGRQLGGEDPIARMMGLAASVPPDAVERRQGLYAVVVSLDPNQLEARFNLATMLAAKQRFEEAMRHFEFLVQSAPAVTSGMIGLAKVQRDLGLLDRARATIRRVLQITPDDLEARALESGLERL